MEKVSTAYVIAAIARSSSVILSASARFWEAYSSISTSVATHGNPAVVNTGVQKTQTMLNNRQTFLYRLNNSMEQCYLFVHTKKGCQDALWA